MEPQNIRFGGGTNVTLLHPLVAVAVLLAVCLMLFLPRRHVIVPLLLALFLIPKGQVIVFAGVHFTMLKILWLTGLIRWVATRRSLTLPGGFNSIDRIFAMWALCYPIVFTLQWMEMQAFVKMAGDCVDTFCGYFVLRFLIQDFEDVRRVVRVFLFLSVVMAVCMTNEQLTNRNVFGLLGGTALTPDFRDGKIRASGVFQHEILAGCFGATLLPIFVSQWTDRKSRLAVLVGVASSIVIVVTANGSTPSLACAAGIFALCLWPFRNWMRLARWGILLALVGLHFVMHGPVWSLLEKIDLTGSSSSYHRYMLIDNCLRHFWDWWLLGVRDYDTWGFDMWDLSNQYVAYAVTGGLATIALFITLICRCFGKLGTAREKMRNSKEKWLLWCLGAALFAHVVGYFGIGYFDQMQFAWFALLSIICVAAFKSKNASAPHAQTRALTPTYQSNHVLDWAALGTQE